MIRPVAANGRIETGGAFTPILRPRVVERISSAALQRIVLIIAPAGYGKSVALRQYLELLEDPHVRYDVRPEHASLLGFVRGFAESLLEIAPDARKTVSGAYEKSRSSKTPGVDLAMWMHAHIKTFTGVIAIDDLHIAENDAEISRFLVSLIDRTKGRARWIIASRSSLDLPVGSWLAYGHMDLNIDEQDLRFTLDEARQTAKVSRVGVRDEELDQILTMTEGWPTALSFALRTSTRSADLRNIAANTREMVYRYLAEQVYRELDDTERDLLHFVGYLPEIDLDVLRHAGYEKAKSIVERLRDRVSFIYPDRPNVYRCHDLFRDFLHHQVELEGDAVVRATQCRVAQALESAGRLPAALSVYTQAHATDEIVRLLEVCGFELMDQAHGDIVQTAIDAIPQDLRAVHPVVLALRAVGAVHAGRLDRADSLFERALGRCQNATLKARIAIALSLFRINQGHDVVALLEDARDDSLPTDLFGEIVSIIAAGYAYTGRIDQAKHAMVEAEGYISEVEGDEVRAKILQRIGATALQLEMPFETISNFLIRASSLASEHAMYNLASRALLFLSLACEFYDDDASKSVWYAQQNVAAGLKAGDRTTVQNGLLQLIHIETLRGNVDRLQALEQQFVATATTDAARMGYIMPMKAALASWRGHFNEAHRIMSTVATSSHYDFDRAFDAGMHALYLVADGQRERALELCARTLAQVNAAEFAYVHGKRIGEMVRLLCAIVEALAGRISVASRILQRRPEHGAPFVLALREAALAITRAMKTPALRDEITEALDGLSAVGYGGLRKTLEVAVASCVAEPSARAGPIVLTKSELDVLEALADGRSPKDIALESGRSVNTVQVHIQNVIRKLGCSGRNEALSIARKQGLLP